jgi:uncharacterized oligopeptide transporter (OPT) family protein
MLFGLILAWGVAVPMTSPDHRLADGARSVDRADPARR